MHVARRIIMQARVCKYITRPFYYCSLLPHIIFLILLGGPQDYTAELLDLDERMTFRVQIYNPLKQ